MPIVGDTPERALRDLLIRFPFLPIDAGKGADRVIGCFAHAFTTQNAEPLAALGLHAAALGKSGDDSSSDDETAVEAKALRRIAQNKAARDAVYTLTYSIIMLNTDLHNPAIHPKITREEYATSCRRCVPLRSIDEDMLNRIFESIRQRPLAIYRSSSGLHTAVHASQHDDDVMTYGDFADNRDRVAASHPWHLGQNPLEGGASVGAMGAVNGTSPPSAPPRAAVKVDWRVAYWNLVDATRYVRAVAWRRASPLLAPPVAVLRHLLQFDGRAGRLKMATLLAAAAAGVAQTIYQRWMLQ